MNIYHLKSTIFAVLLYFESINNYSASKSRILWLALFMKLFRNISEYVSVTPFLGRAAAFFKNVPPRVVASHKDYAAVTRDAFYDRLGQCFMGPAARSLAVCCLQSNTKRFSATECQSGTDRSFFCRTYVSNFVQ